MAFKHKGLSKESYEKAGQPSCVTCNSKVLQLILIELIKDSTSLHLLCGSCGQLQTINLEGIAQQSIKTKKINEKEPSYFG